MATARVSTVVHMIFGHPPVLLTMLEKGNARRVQIAGMIEAIRRPEAVLLEDASSSFLGRITVGAIAEGVSNQLLPQFANYVTETLSSAHASVVDLVYPHRTFGQSSQLPQLAAEYVHPYVLGQLHLFMQNEDTTLGFKNIQQAIITQEMYKGKRHLRYISPIGMAHYTL